MAKVTKTLKIYDGFSKHYDHYPTALALQGLILSRTGKPIEGEKLIRAALQIRTETLKPGHYFTALVKSALGECLVIQKRFAEAEPLLLESYRELKNSQGEQNPRTLLAQRRLLALYQQWKKSEQAKNQLPP